MRDLLGGTSSFKRNHGLCLMFLLRFTGADPEPRPGLPSGHIPFSFSVPFSLFLNTHTLPDSDIQFTKFKSSSEIQVELQNGIGLANFRKALEGKCNIVTTCGSGMTAGILWLGLKTIGIEEISLFDEVGLCLYLYIFGFLRTYFSLGLGMRPETQVLSRKVQQE